MKHKNTLPARPASGKQMLAELTRAVQEESDCLNWHAFTPAGRLNWLLTLSVLCSCIVMLFLIWNATELIISQPPLTMALSIFSCVTFIILISFMLLQSSRRHDTYCLNLPERTLYRYRKQRLQETILLQPHNILSFSMSSPSRRQHDWRFHLTLYYDTFNIKSLMILDAHALSDNAYTILLFSTPNDPPDMLELQQQAILLQAYICRRCNIVLNNI